MKNNPSTQAARSAATRDALIAAARPLFAEHGFGGVGTEAIVRAAGLSRGALYHHFADKTDLFAAVFETVEAAMTERIAAAMAEAPRSDPVAVMRLGARVWLDACAEPEVHRIVLLEAPSALGWERWREICLRYAMGLVRGLISHAIEAGRLPKQPVDPLAHVLIGALDEAALYLARAGDRRTAHQQVGAVIDRLILSMTTA